MITPSEALDLIRQHSRLNMGSEICSVTQCIGRVLADHIIAPISLPPFTQAAMDGYALRLHHSETYTILDEIKAGDSKDPELKEGEATRIFTGAAVPQSANAVVMQEKTERQGSMVRVSEPVEAGLNIRTTGEQLSKGETALTRGTLLNESSIGLLYSLGITEVLVHRKPKIALIVTGNELKAPGEKLDRGQIYNSNGPMLRMALSNAGFNDVPEFHVKDDRVATESLFQNISSQFDMILISGGISVGDYDFVAEALEASGVQTLFHKIAQRPGKPLYFGSNGKTLFFGLPGNPASSLTCFYVYVIPALLNLHGAESQAIRFKTPLNGEFTNASPLSLFLKGRADTHGVTLSDRQQSSMVMSFSYSNCIVCIPPGPIRLEPQTLVDIIPLPGRS